MRSATPAHTHTHTHTHNTATPAFHNTRARTAPPARSMSGQIREWRRTAPSSRAARCRDHPFLVHVCCALRTLPAFAALAGRYHTHSGGRSTVHAAPQGAEGGCYTGAGAMRRVLRLRVRPSRVRGVGRDATDATLTRHSGVPVASPLARWDSHRRRRASTALAPASPLQTMPHTYGDAGADAASAEAPGAAAHQRSADKHGGGAEGQCFDHVGACTASFSSEPGSTQHTRSSPT